MNKRAFKMRPCACCGLLKGAESFPSTRSPFFPDGHLTICGDCLDQELSNANGEWATMDFMCAWGDVPFIPEQFTKIWNSVPEHAVSQYFKLFSNSEYNRIHWDTYQQRWKDAIKDNQEQLIHPLFNQEELDRMRRTWGSGYSDEDLYYLEDLYNGLKQSFGISDPSSEDTARKMCKISKEIDRCIAQGGQGIDKLVGSYQKLQQMGGFSSENAKDFNNFDSISELALYMEKIGWKKKFHNEETNDVVDSTMKNIQAYNRRLYQNESTIGDQIDTMVSAKKRIDALEDQIFEEEVDQYENAAYQVEETESFDPNI